jgi:hypothetical protein
MVEYQNLIAHLALALGASWCAGLNLYATLAVLGLMANYVPGFHLPPDLAILGSPYVMLPAIFMYCLEFFADKIPAVDSAWDTVHTFIRVPAGAILAAAALGNVPPELQVGAAMIGGTLALGAHTTKATARVAAHATGTSLLVSPAASILEDGLVIGTVSLLAAHPYLSIAMTVLMIIASAVLLRVLWRVARKVIQSLTGRRRVYPAPAMNSSRALPLN